MRELFFERRIVIEAIHSAGHTPLYIETEPYVKDEKARDTMNRLVADADGFISLSYLSLGKQDKKLLNNLTPIQYELELFLKCRKDEKAPVIFLREEPDHHVKPSQNLLDWIEENEGILKTETKIFKNPEDLEKKIEDVLKDYEKKVDITNAKPKFIVTYVGPDFIGLIGSLSEIAFTNYGLNLDYISHASTGKKATTYISCSRRTLVKNIRDENDLKKKLKRDMQRTLPRIIEDAKRNKLLDENINPKFDIDVSEDYSHPQPYQFFTIVRTIDAPGQLNIVCKELRAKKFNIDEFQLRPSSPEHHRQTTMTMWLSRIKDEKDVEKCKEDYLAELERTFRYLTGVRSFEIRALDCP
jgi:hypothetical protein